MAKFWIVQEKQSALPQLRKVRQTSSNQKHPKLIGLLLKRSWLNLRDLRRKKLYPLENNGDNHIGADTQPNR